MKDFKKSVNTLKEYVLKILKLLLCGIGVGVLCGLCGTLFSKSVSFVTNLRSENRWLVFLLPLGGLISVWVYNLCRVNEYGTKEIIESARSGKKVPSWLSVAIFSGTVISHTFGASAGREGAALQLGGSIGSYFARIFKAKDNLSRMLVMCGMSSLFAAIFGTPVAACVFVIEIIMNSTCAVALLPMLISNITAYKIAKFLGVKHEHYAISNMPEFDFITVCKTAIIVAAGIVVAYIFITAIGQTKALFNKCFKNPYIRIAVGGVLIAALTCLVKSPDYNGGGTEVIERIFETGNVKYEAFALKIIFTAVTIAAGYKGGEIIPTLFIGAAYGAQLALLFGLSPSYGAAIGIAVLFSCLTKCPIATVFLCAEMFGLNSVLFITAASVTGFFFARYKGFYDNTVKLNLTEY